MHFNISTRNIRTGYPGLQELETRNLKPKNYFTEKNSPHTRTFSVHWGY